jgi:hypothetical protein
MYDRLHVFISQLHVKLFLSVAMLLFLFYKTQHNGSYLVPKDVPL